MSPRAASLGLSAALCLGLTACSGVDDDYPQLLPMDQILTDPTPVSDPVAVQAQLGGGAAALRARAAALRGPVIDPATRARMTAMRDRHR